MRNKKHLESKMEQCTLELFAIFAEQNIGTPSCINNLQKIQKYYSRRFLENKASQDNILKEYQVLINTIKQVKKGAISSTEGLKVVQNFSSKRKIEVAFANILKGCELLFWMATAVTSYTFCLGLAIPLIFFNPPLGIAMALGTSTMMLAATLKGAGCIREFRSFSAINKEAELERNTISFFNLSKYETKPEIGEELSQIQACC